MFRSALSFLRNIISKDHLTESSFDKKYSIDTSGYYDLETMDVDIATQEHGHDYQGTPITVLKELIDQIPEDPSSFTFIDYGSGLGRTLFNALELGFNKIIGIEYCEEFYQKSIRNINTSHLPEKNKRQLHVIHMDASEYLPPETDCILYFFNPFDEQLLSKTIKNIQKSYLNNPRKIYVIYYNPWYRNIMDDTEELEVVAERDLKNKSFYYKYYSYVIYQLRNH